MAIERVSPCVTAMLLALVLAASSALGQEAHELRFGFQPGDVYHYDIELGSSFVAGETYNHEAIRGVETLVVTERHGDRITILPVASGLRITDFSALGGDLETFAKSQRRWTEPFFGTGLLYENPPDVPGHAFLGKIVVHIDDMGHAPVEDMVPRFWSPLIPIGEWLQNYAAAAAYPWPVLPADPVTTGQVWALTIPGAPDSIHFSYAGRDSEAAPPCDLIEGALDVAPEISSRWGAREGTEVRTTLCLADEGFPVHEELRASQRLGEGQNEQWIRTELVGSHRLEDPALEIVRQAADTAFPHMAEPDSEAIQEIVGQPAPQLSLQSSESTTSALSDLAGRVTVIHFWAPWSSQSTQTLAGLLALRADFQAEEVAVLPVMVEDEASQLLGLSDVVLARLDSTAVGYRPAVADLPAYHANEIMPLTLILDEQRIVRKAYTGYVAESELHEAISGLLPRP